MRRDRDSLRRIPAFDWIRENIEYRYGVSECTTGALETLKHKAGVCRDFAHLGITFCRALGIPARLAVGFLPGAERLQPVPIYSLLQY